MAIGKQSKTLSDKQVEVMTSYLINRRNGLRNVVIFLLSAKAGLRAKEIASLKWSMVVTSDGKLSDSIHLTNKASKGNSGRVIPINPILKSSFM